MTDLIAKAQIGGGPLVLVGIGGRGGAGKTTLALAILPAPRWCPTDVFWNGEEFDLGAAPARGGSKPLAARRAGGARYAAYDWAARTPAGERGGGTEAVWS